jgi:hypothetical protein
METEAPLTAGFLFFGAGPWLDEHKRSENIVENKEDR